MFNIVTVASIKQMLAEIELLYRSTDINYRIFRNSGMLERWDGVMWTGLVWLRIGTGGELL
jgi:hypothetical protein